MPVTLTDDVLKAAGMTEGEALVEIACRFFDTGRLSKFDASRLAGLSRLEFEAELMKRNLSLIHIDEEYWRQELESLRRFERQE